MFVLPNHMLWSASQDSPIQRIRHGILSFFQQSTHWHHYLFDRLRCCIVHVQWKANALYHSVRINTHLWRQNFSFGCLNSTRDPYLGCRNWQWKASTALFQGVWPSRVADLMLLAMTCGDGCRLLHHDNQAAILLVSIRSHPFLSMFIHGHCSVIATGSSFMRCRFWQNLYEPSINGCLSWIRFIDIDAMYLTGQCDFTGPMAQGSP